MHTRRLASLFIGAWLAASILMDFVVISNFRQVDEFLTAPSPLAVQQIHSMGGKTEARIFLRHEVGELNRYLFEQWEYAQIVLGVALLGVFLFGHGDTSKAGLVLTICMLVVVLIDRTILTPQITTLGRLLDYPNTPGADKSLFWTLHGTYSGLELLKLAFGLGVAGILLANFTDRKRFVKEHEKLSRTQVGLNRG
jgi:hypothetical protein